MSASIIRAVPGVLALVIAALLMLSGAAVAEESEDATLAPGDAGEAVVVLQRALRVPADGDYGRQTRRAVRAFQREHGIRANGIAGPETLAALGIRLGAVAAAGAEATTLHATLAGIAECESGGDPTAVSRDGRYRGKYQFSRATWRNLGGTGDPAGAPEAEQDQRAAALYAQEGSAPWPSCA